MAPLQLKLRIDWFLASAGETTVYGTVAAAALLFFIGALGSLPVSHVSGGFEGVGHFAGSTGVPEEPAEEEVQLGGIGGMAVNYTGAGGVKAGTVYAASNLPGELRIGMFVPVVDPETSELELEFKLSWKVAETEEPKPARCGPALGTNCTPRVQAGPGWVDVDVDQVSGTVYAYNREIIDAGKKLVVVYSPEGEDELTRFGEKAPAGAKTAESPEKIHRPVAPGGIAVNDIGEVYVYDLDGSASEFHRLMKFRPVAPGKFDAYEYAGTDEDVGAGFLGEGRNPEKPAIDAAGNVYVAPEETHIEVYDPSKPGDPPLCDFEMAKSGITALTVNPKTGEPFFFNEKPPKRIYQLGVCNPATGKFEGKGGEEIVDEFAFEPERDNLWGLAFDPARSFSPTRPAGVLYGGVPRPGLSEAGKTSLGYIFAPAEEVSPAVEEQLVSQVSEKTARLRAVIDPNGFKTHYAFEYLTEAAYQEAGESFEGAQKAPLGGANLKGTGAPEAVAVTLSGLQPDTAYRFRAVAQSNCAVGEPEKVCEDTGQAQPFRTYPTETPGPHDDRAYELVSPADKNGGQVLPADPGISSCGVETECKPGEAYLHFPMQSAPSGDAVAYEGTPFAPGVGATIENQYLSHRTGSGWETANLTPSLMKGTYKAFDAELTRAVLGQVGPPPLDPEAPFGFENLYAQPVGDPLSLQPLLGLEPPNQPTAGEGEFKFRYAGASADLSRVFIAANDALTGADPGIAPEAEDGGAGKFNLYEWEEATGQLRLVNVLPGNAESKAGAVFGVEGGGTTASGVPSAHPISADGSRAFWSDDETGQLYVREDASATVEIPDSGKFLSAATDGSRVLLDNGHIYDLETEETTDLTGGKGGFEGIAGQSDDLTHVYFVDTEVLAEGENSEGAKAEAGKFNLYAWSGGVTSYVGTLVAPDNNGANRAHSRSWETLPSQRTAEASPAGRFLAFLSVVPLTGYDNTGPCEAKDGKLVEAPCSEVFLYDSATGALYCPSCNRSGASPLGFSTLRVIKGLESLPQPRYLLDSGRLYFDSQDSLSQFDTNGGVEDVYEFEPEGEGSCGREGGCVALISSGHDPFDSNLLAIDQTGKNVFFTSRNRLVVADGDELIDLYDAREGGGPPPSSEPPKDEIPLQVPPVKPIPASPSVNDSGNVKPPKSCKKGQVKKKNKCVKKHKSKRGKKSKRGGAK